MRKLVNNDINGNNNNNNNNNILKIKIRLLHNLIIFLIIQNGSAAAEISFVD